VKVQKKGESFGTTRKGYLKGVFWSHRILSQRDQRTAKEKTGNGVRAQETETGKRRTEGDCQYSSGTANGQLVANTERLCDVSFPENLEMNGDYCFTFGRPWHNLVFKKLRGEMGAFSRGDSDGVGHESVGMGCWGWTKAAGLRNLKGRG